jgi:ribosome-associated toxin RatA of RatAB toxin-antitoxin module
MKPLVGCGFSLLLGVLSKVAMGQGPELSAVQQERLRAGDVLIEDTKNESGIHGLRATFLVNATRKAVWDLLLDYKNYAKIFTGVEELSVLKENEQGARVKYRIKAGPMTFEYTLQRDYKQPGERLTWRRVDGDFKAVAGEWLIHGWDVDHKLVVCDSYVDVGFFIPTALVRAGARAEMQNTMHRVQQQLVSRAK